MLICILTKNVITSCSVTMMLFLHLEVKPLMTLTTVLYLSCALISGHLRSEERRVGKECIYRWWPDQHNTVALDVTRHRHVERFAGVTDALKTTVLESYCLPDSAAHQV